jgi:predicted transglutaminase-like cysteine proteinase
MTRVLKRECAGVLLVALGLAVVVNAGAAAERVVSTPSIPHGGHAYAVIVGITNPLIGWVNFCIRYKPECDTTPLKPRDVVLTPSAWSEMVKVNNLVNNNIKPMPDLKHWGVADSWDYPDDDYGDCEDYVLLKRRLLMRAGWPRQALLITVVRDGKGEGHAVLTVKTDKGEFVLDNQEPQVLLWDKTGYQFEIRQSQSDPNVWVGLSAPHDASATVTADTNLSPHQRNVMRRRQDIELAKETRQSAIYWASVLRRYLAGRSRGQ